MTIAVFNKRAQRVCAKAGFRVVSQFERARDGRPFLIMRREAE
jgi:RimJ/RimL family protein N-acetyltransferase